MTNLSPNQPRTIDPTVDLVFKMLLGSEKNKNLTLSFLNAALGLKGKQRIVEIEFPNTPLAKDHVADKGAIVDIKVKDGHGNVYQIEIQNRFHKHQDKRVFHNWTKVAAVSLNEKEYYDKLRTAISIWIMSERFLPRKTTKAVRLKYVMHCPEEGLSLCPENFIVLFQLPNLVDDGKMDHDLMMWLRIFKEGKHIDPNHPPEWAQQGISKEVMEVLRYIANDRDEYLAYDSFIKARRDREGLLESEAEARRQEKKAKVKALKDLRLERRAKEKALKDLNAERMAKEAERSAKEAERMAKEAERMAKEAALKANEVERSAKESALMEIERLRALLGKSLES